MTAMFRTNQCVVVTLPLFLISSAPLAIQTYKKHNSGGVIKIVALMPVRKKCVKYLSTIVYCLHAVKILEVFIKMYIFSKKTLRTYDLIFKVHILDIAWDFLFILRIL